MGGDPNGERGGSSSADVAQLQIEVSADVGIGADDLAELTYSLREDLLALDVDEAEPVAFGDAPPGTKGVELAMLGGLLVKLARSAGGLRAVVRTIASWVERANARSVRIELDGDVLEVTGVSSADQRALIDAWISRQAQPA